MKLVTIRFSVSVQASLYLSETVHQEYSFLTVLSTGWTSGSRNRSKNFKDFASVYGWLNKLNIGGWLSDDDYDECWRIVLDTELSVMARPVFVVADATGEQPMKPHLSRYQRSVLDEFVQSVDDFTALASSTSVKVAGLSDIEWEIIPYQFKIDLPE